MFLCQYSTFSFDHIFTIKPFCLQTIKKNNLDLLYFSLQNYIVTKKRNIRNKEFFSQSSLTQKRCYRLNNQWNIKQLVSGAKKKFFNSLTLTEKYFSKSLIQSGYLNCYFAMPNLQPIPILGLWFCISSQSTIICYQEKIIRFQFTIHNLRNGDVRSPKQQYSI